LSGYKFQICLWIHIFLHIKQCKTLSYMDFPRALFVVCKVLFFVRSMFFYLKPSDYVLLTWWQYLKIKIDWLICTILAVNLINTVITEETVLLTLASHLVKERPECYTKRNQIFSLSFHLHHLIIPFDWKQCFTRWKEKNNLLALIIVIILLYTNTFWLM
jgi:hypothetical protein